MAALVKYLFNTLYNTVYRRSADSNNNDSIESKHDDETQAENQSDSPTAPESRPHQPTIQELLEIKDILLEKTKLPMELIDNVVDLAQLWPHVTTVTPHSPEHPLHIRSDANQLILRTYPLGFIPSEEQRSKSEVAEHATRGTHVPQMPMIANQAQETNEETTATSDQEAPKPVVGEYSTTLLPQAWPNSVDFPKEATQDVLYKWAQTSLPREEFPCRKIVFTIKSHDQGWGGGANDRGTYNGSFTWFEVGLERVSAFYPKNSEKADTATPQPQFLLPSDMIDSKNGKADKSTPKPILISQTLIPETIPNSPTSSTSATQYTFKHDLNPGANCLQRNVVADGKTKTHVITWSYDDDILPESLEGNALNDQGRGRETGTGEFVRSLRLGDVVTVWAKARFQGWVNVVEEVKVDVYWVI